MAVAGPLSEGSPALEIWRSHPARIYGECFLETLYWDSGMQTKKIPTIYIYKYNMIYIYNM
jgi:hypothetical protein